MRASFFIIVWCSLALFLKLFWVIFRSKMYYFLSIKFTCFSSAFESISMISHQVLKAIRIKNRARIEEGNFVILSVSPARDTQNQVSGLSKILQKIFPSLSNNPPEQTIDNYKKWPWRYTKKSRKKTLKMKQKTGQTKNTEKRPSGETCLSNGTGSAFNCPPRPQRRERSQIV